MERLKYLSRDGGHLLKFEGYGHHGERIRRRNEALASSGFGTPYSGQMCGFGRQVLESGRMGRQSDSTPQLLRRMAEYCAWRSREFATSDADAGELATMARVNLQREFGIAVEMDLKVEHPLSADGRMQPHEWFCTEGGEWLKLDGATHGDDHFFPGPCDIAWDIAGAIVEWGLDSSAREFFLSHYSRLSGDHPSQRIDHYELAYATFRLAWSRMAAGSVQGTDDEERLLHDYRRYREFVAGRAHVSGLSPV
jgi:hypothetical protein